MLGPWSIGEAFKPADGLTFERFPPTNPLHLTVRGIKVSTVLFCGNIMTDANTLGRYVLSLLKTGAFNPLSLETLTLFCHTLSAGRNAYGGREIDREALVPHFTAHLMKAARLTLPQKDLGFVESDIIIHLAKSGNPDTYIDTTHQVFQKPSFIRHCERTPRARTEGNVSWRCCRCSWRRGYAFNSPQGR